MDDATLIQEPAYRLPPFFAPLPVPDADSVTALADGTPCMLVRVRKGTEHDVVCVPMEVRP